MTTRTRRAVIGMACLTLFLSIPFIPGLPWSAWCHHKLRKIRTRAEMRLAQWQGSRPQLASIAGRLTIRKDQAEGLQGAQVEALDSASGWAGMTDREGRFVLPDVMWYPGAQYGLIVSADPYTARHLKVTAPERLPASGLFDAGELAFDQGCEINLSETRGTNSISYLEYDAGDMQYYGELFARLSAGKESDEERLDALNQYVATRLNPDENAPEAASPRQVLESGSRYCGQLALVMALLAEAGGYKARILHLSNGAAPPGYDAVLEVYYDDRWHLYDPAFGAAFRNREGVIASYRELRLDPGLLPADLFQKHHLKTIHSVSDRLPDFYRSGFHHVYYLEKGR